MQTNKSEALLYVPSDTPEAMTMATRRVAGVLMIVRGIMTLTSYGIKRCTILITDTQRERIERFLERYSDKQLPQIDILCYSEPYSVNSDIIQKVSETAADRILVINANLLFEKCLLDSLKPVDSNDKRLILCQEGVHPIPIMSAPKELLDTLLPFTQEKARSIEGCLRQIIKSGEVRNVQKPDLINTFLVKRHRDRAVAEKFLTESIRHSTHGPVAKYINKRLSLPASLMLSKLWISPNAITALNIIIGLFSGVFVADGHRYDIILLGAVLFQLASIIDGCDGEVAKLTFRCSKFGQYIDSMSDNLSLGSFMTGLIAGYWRHTHSHIAFIAGAMMIICTAITLFWMIQFLKKNTQSASLVTFDNEYLKKLSGQPSWLLSFIKYGKYFLKKDMFSFVFLLFAIFGILYWWLFIAAFGTFISAAILTYLNLQSRIANKQEHPLKTFRINSEGRSI